MKDILAVALDAAVAAGATYADVRGIESSSESVSVRGEIVEGLDRAESAGFGVRVICDGAWGYAATASLSSDEATSAAHQAVEVARASALATTRPVELVPEPVHKDSWTSPLEIDPLAVPLEEKVSLLIAAAAPMDRKPPIRVGRATLDLMKQRILFLSSEGSDIEQVITHTGAGIEAIAVGESEVQQRSYPGSFRGDYVCGGWEYVW